MDSMKTDTKAREVTLQMSLGSYNGVEDIVTELGIWFLTLVFSISWHSYPLE